MVAHVVNDKTEILTRIREQKRRLHELGAVRLGLFGSFVRGEQHDNSDVDLLVEFAPGKKSYRNFIKIIYLLEDLLGRDVELITKESLSQRMLYSIYREAEYVSLDH